MKPRAFRLLGASELERVVAASGEALARWCSAWFGPGAANIVDARSAAGARPLAVAEAPVARAADYARWAAMLAGPGAYRAAATRFAAQAGDAVPARGELPPVLRGAIDECFATLADELLALVRAQAVAGSAADVDSAWAPGSGAAVVTARLDGETFGALLGPGVVSALAGAIRPSPRGGLARRMDCIQGRGVPVHVWAGGAELGLGSLASITPGDVIVLDARIDETFALTGPGGTPLGRGFLGVRAASKALQLVS
ncbi:MAG TPA: FliM/FliN family flagellar motor C-terminal domain-containing protein [Burkholderiales bacterium]